ncbi:MAG: DUF2892 domain-containing protein [Rhodospirillales bacterium]|nr:MAG: DUF2892 domain-containing protein [Rhodospirillales bacterium]
MPSTVERVARNTRDGANQRIRRRTAERLAHYIAHTREIPRRLRELDAEWDIERVLEANAASVTLAGVVLAGLDRRWLALPALVAAFLFQHAAQGWCPPLPVLRELGFRTAREIEIERVALKLLRGDFDVDTVSGTTAENAEAAIAAATA